MQPILPCGTRATLFVGLLQAVPYPSWIAMATTHRPSNARLGGHAHAPRDDSLQHDARNHHCSCSQPPRATTAARSLRPACDHARARVQCSNAAPFAGARAQAQQLQALSCQLAAPACQSPILTCMHEPGRPNVALAHSYTVTVLYNNSLWLLACCSKWRAVTAYRGSTAAVTRQRSRSCLQPKQNQ
jgi:hypothetical protein